MVDHHDSQIAVIRAWRHGSGVLARITLEDAEHGEPTAVVINGESDLVEFVRSWLHRL